MHQIDTQKVEEAIQMLIRALGDDPNREGLKETPKRVGKVIGLSKIARIADMCSKRLQLQERIGTDIYEVLKEVLGTEDIIVVIEGSHSCMTARGVKKVNSKTKTACCKGLFRDNPDLRKEFYSLIGGK